MAARAVAHVALAPPASIPSPRTPRRAKITASNLRAWRVARVGASRSPALPAFDRAARWGQRVAPTPRERDVAVGVRSGAGAPGPGPDAGAGHEAEWEEGWRAKGAARGVAPRGRGRGGRRGGRVAGGADGGGFESPADVFATVNAEGFGVSSNLPKPSHASDLAASPAPTPRGRKRAWVRKQWKALTGIGDETDAVAIDGASEADVGAQPSPPQFAEADGGVLKDDVMEERSPEPSLVGEDTTAASDGSDKDGVSESNGAGGAMHGASGATGGKKKTDKRYLAVTPPKPYTVMRINAPDASENPGTHFNQQLTRRALLRDAELTPRDLRRIDPSLLQTNNTPALLVKDQTIMVNLGVRVIIRPDHALLFEPDTATAQRFLAAVDTRHRVVSPAGADDANVSSAKNGRFGADAEMHGENQNEDLTKDYDLDKAPGGTGGAPIPFELEVVEAALQETMSQLYAKLEFCEERCRQVSARLRASINPAVLEELRLTKQSLVALDSRAGSVRQVLLDTLDDDDDITDFTISSTAVTEEDKEDEEEEVENLIEYYLQQTETVHNAAEQLLENTRDLEESISVSLSSRRYEVSKLELTLSIATFAAALGALVTGIFGMNLRSCLEESITAFYLTCFLIVGGIGAIFQSIMKFARRQKIL